MDVGTWIKHKRKEKGYTQVGLAVKAQVSLPTIQNIEAHKANPTLELLEKMGVVLGFTIKISSVEPDWALLQQYGLPMVVQEGIILKEAFMPMLFAEQLLVAVHFVLETKNQDERLLEALIALLWSIKKHYFTYYQYFLLSGDKEMVNTLLNQPIAPDRLLKLSRIALSKISKVL